MKSTKRLLTSHFNTRTQRPDRFYLTRSNLLCMISLPLQHRYVSLRHRYIYHNYPWELLFLYWISHRITKMQIVAAMPAQKRGIFKDKKPIVIIPHNNPIPAKAYWKLIAIKVVQYHFTCLLAVSRHNALRENHNAGDNDIVPTAPASSTVVILSNPTKLLLITKSKKNIVRKTTNNPLLFLATIVELLILLINSSPSCFCLF